MLPVEHQSYVPTLRLKQGEYLALGEITAESANRLLPHFVLPPPSDRDPEKKRVLTSDEIVYESGTRVGRHWPLRPCLLDARYLFKKLGDSEATIWLPRLFKVAEDHHARPIPIIELSELETRRFNAYRILVNPADSGIALRLTLRDLGDEKLQERIHKALLKIVALPSQCVLMLDLAGTDYSQPEPVGEFIVGSFQRVFEIGRWRRIIASGTSYPDRNPAPENDEIVLPRNEWKAWRSAIAHDETIQQNLAYGDYGADSSKFVFSGGIAPIRHYRYSTENYWLVVRGNKSADLKDTMKDVAARIVKSQHYLGKTFSRGDKYIFDCAKGVDGPGSAMTWRKVNTIHHLTLITSELGKLYGYTIGRIASLDTQLQRGLFDEYVVNEKK